MKNSVARRYLRRVKWRLVCPRLYRKRLEARLRTMIFGFAEEYPEANYKQYVANFGSPQTFANAILEEADPEQIEKSRRQRRFICWGSVVCVVAALAVAVAFWYTRCQEIRDLSKNIVIVELPPEEMTEEEFMKIINNESKQ